MKAYCFFFVQLAEDGTYRIFEHVLALNLLSIFVILNKMFVVRAALM